MANLYTMAEVENSASQHISISAKDVELSIKNEDGRLILVKAGNLINGNESIKIAPESVRSLKIEFVIPDEHQLMLSNSINTTLRLTIEGDIAIISKWVNVEF